MPYAATTQVSPESSRAEIEKMLRKFWQQDNAKKAGQYPPMQFQYRSTETFAEVMFLLRGRIIKMVLPLPSQSSEDVCTVMQRGRRVKLSGDQAYKKWEAVCRSRWRGLALAIKTMINNIEIDVSTFEEVFLPYFMTANGQTVAELMIPKLEQDYKSGRMQSLLGPATGVN